jgi:hypothetical protein
VIDARGYCSTTPEACLKSASASEKHETRRYEEAPFMSGAAGRIYCVYCCGAADAIAAHRRLSSCRREKCKAALGFRTLGQSRELLGAWLVLELALGLLPVYAAAPALEQELGEEAGGSSSGCGSQLQPIVADSSVLCKIFRAAR